MAGDGSWELFVETTSRFEVCPRCACKSSSVYDHRAVRVRDTPVRTRQVVLRIRKRRFWCKPCQKPFTEPVAGVGKGKRFTERFRKSIHWACETFSAIKDVSKAYRCSYGFIYKTFYQELERVERQRHYPWPKAIGLDEHFFRKKRGYRGFVTVVVDFKGRRLREVVEGRDRASLHNGLQDIQGRENVQWVSCDLADSYKSFARDFFPNANIVADKFHVLRLLNPAINRYRKAITGDKRKHPSRRLLLRSGIRLKWHERSALNKWLDQHSDLQQIYWSKEAMHRLYRCRGRKRASRSLTNLTDALANTKIPELKTLRRTLMRWKNEILNHFSSGLTNAMAEGFNNVAKVVKKRAYGYKSFKNYRLRLLSACA